MLPVVTCLDVASTDATRTNNCDIWKWWESLWNFISQNMLPEISAYEVTIPRVNDWPYIGCIDHVWEHGEFVQATNDLKYPFKDSSWAVKFLCLVSFFFPSTRQQFHYFFSLSEYWKRNWGADVCHSHRRL